ncbi:MAG: hypothetical protein V3U75_01350 [Methylococcaceae bacterium]
MPRFGKTSTARLRTCHPSLQKLFNEVVKHFDCSIIGGHRNEAEQDKVFYDGKSTVQFPNSKHNSIPSMAVDVVPYPIDWKDRNRMRYFAGFVKGIATGMGYKIRWGGDWDSDTEVKDNHFQDLPHFEIKT